MSCYTLFFPSPQTSCSNLVKKSIILSKKFQFERLLHDGYLKIQPCNNLFNIFSVKLKVSMHNKLRAAVARGDERRGGGGGGGQPEAANMMSLEWDPELAMVAQRWADQCTFGHDQV